MNDDYNFGYKSFEEIRAEQEKGRARRKTVVFVVLTLFLAVFAVLMIGIWLSGRASTFRQTVRQSDVQLPDLSETTQGSEGRSYSLPQSSQPQGGSELVIVTDVSSVVDKCCGSVVCIRTEVYSSFSTQSSGSGIILDENGYIVTNNHVISGGDSITVTLNDGRTFPAYRIGSDEYTDIAVIKIEADGLLPAEFGNSDELRVGETAVAIGNPTGQLMGTVTAGIISALSRNIMVNNNMMTLIQTDASINSGNSGGPLINRFGQVVGINSAKLSSANYEGIGFAIPINTVRPIVEELILKGYVSGRPLVGLNVSEVSYMASTFYGIPQGLYVNAALRGSSAASSLSAGDVIVAVDGVRVTTLSDAIVKRNEHKPEDTLTVTVYRRGRTVDIDLLLGEQNTDNTDYNF